MKKMILLSLLFVPQLVSADDNRPITIVELFTSQGCSSCPPADANLSRLAKRKFNDRRVVTLSFHVDYWDYLGWKDPFSAKRFTVRQQRYAEVMNLKRMYTPQMIVNGQYEFVGSNSKLIDQALDLTNPKPAHMVNAVLESSDSTKARIKATINGETTGWLVNFAIVQESGENDVPRGENAQRHLKHTSVVRAFDVQRAAKDLTAELELPKNFDSSQARAVVYVQNQSTGIIDGATVLPLKPKETDPKSRQ